RNFPHELPLGRADVLCALEKLFILCLRPRLEVVKGDVGELTAERCAIDRVADTVEPLVHLGAVLTHALADDVQGDLEIGERATGDTREDGEEVVAVSSSPPRSKRLPAKRPGSSSRLFTTAPPCLPVPPVTTTASF